MSIPTLPWGLYHSIARTIRSSSARRTPSYQQPKQKVQKPPKEPEIQDYLTYAVRTNPELTSFFKKLENKMQDIRTFKSEEIRKKAQRIANLIDSRVETAETIESELLKEIEMGGSPKQVSYYLGRFNPRNIYSALNEQQHDSELKCFEYSTEFCGVKLTIKDIEDSKNKSLEDEIIEISNSINEKRTEKSKLSKKLKRLERKRIIPFFQPDKTGVKKDELRKKISELNIMINKSNTQKAKYKVLSKLTPKQKELIVKYMRIWLDIIRLCREIKYLESDFKYCIPGMYDGDLVTSALDMLIKDGMPKEELEYVVREFKRIINDREAYPHYGPHDSELGAMLHGFSRAISKSRI